MRDFKNLRQDIATSVHAYLNALVESAEDNNDPFDQEDLAIAETQVRLIVADAIKQFLQAQVTR